MRNERTSTQVRRSIRSRLLLIVFIPGILSTVCGLSITLVYLNVVIRRESAFLIEERISAVVNRSQTWVHLQAAASEAGVGSAIQPLQGRDVTREQGKDLPGWLGTSNFSGIVLDHRSLEVRSIDHIPTPGGFARYVIRVPVDRRFLMDTARSAGLEITGAGMQPVDKYRGAEGLQGEVIANFVPGSARPVPVIVTVTDWETGQRRDWVICELKLNYEHTLSELSHMGLRTASWVAPVLSLSFGLLAVWLTGVVFSIRFSNSIAKSIDHLNKAAQEVGKGNLTVELEVTSGDQLESLAECFNNMLHKLRVLREQERHALLVETDLKLASEVQAYLTPTTPALMHGATAWSTSTPARSVSGDLHEILPFSTTKVGLLCADVSGKGVASALLTSHLQGLVHAYLRSSEPRLTPANLARRLNRDLWMKSQQSRYATFFYAEADLAAHTLTYVNAGHVFPIVTTSNRTRILSDGDMPLGLFPDASFIEHHVPLDVGSSLIVYTDGVTEALNTNEQEFGEERLLTSIQSFTYLADATKIGQALRTELIRWADGIEQFDDATFLVLHVNG